MDKKIKVLHTEWSDGWGGQEIRIINEMLAVREKGVEVFLACRNHSQIKQKALENDIKVFTLPFKGSLDLKTIFALKNIVKKENIDIINTHSGKDTWVGGLAAKIAGVKFIRTRHLSNPINPSRLNLINELADFIFTTGESVRDAMIKNNRINPDKIISIPTGIDANIFDPKQYDRKKCRRIFNINNDEVIVGILAVLRDFKRHDNFLKIAKKLIYENPDKKFRFIIAGEGPKRKSIEKMITNLNLEQHTDMIGHITNVAEFLTAIDIFILPSDKNEGVPQSLIQALMMEKKCVSTTAGSINDLYSNNNFLFSTPNIDEIYSNVNALVQDLISVQPNRKYILQYFSKQEITKKIIYTYRKLIDEKADKLNK